MLAHRITQHLVRLASRRRHRLVAAAVAAASICLAATAASASAYVYQPGDPLYIAQRSVCTGGYVVRNANGAFLLTAGHCGTGTVSGSSRPFGYVAWTFCLSYTECNNNPGYGRDTELVKQNYRGDGWSQTVRDPRTGRLPGTSGKVVAWVHRSALVRGYVVGKMGVTTGWTEGRVDTLLWWHNMLAYCSTAHAAPGDSGGPVWRAAPGGGVYAIGITVATYGSDSCFIPIEDLLSLWRAQLPGWSHAASRASYKTAVKTARKLGMPLRDGKRARELIRHAS